jgi:Putative MetA-pathway of phenol degradation
MTPNGVRTGAWIARSVVVAVSAALLSTPAFAGAWTLKEGTGQAILTTSYYVTTDRFDADRHRVSGTRFEKVTINPYLEYGLTDGITLGLSPEYEFLQDHVGAGRIDRTNGFGDVETFARGRLWHDDWSVLSVQGLVRAPTGYDDGRSPALGYGHVDLEGRVLYGLSGKLGGTSWYTDVEAGLRKRYGPPADEARVDLAIGWRPVPDWLLLAQSFNTQGLRNASGSTAAQANGPDYDSFKLQLSAVYALSERVSVQAGGWRELGGRNAGAGNGGLLALWLSF